jgi:hypothetical protein
MITSYETTNNEEKYPINLELPYIFSYVLDNIHNEYYDLIPNKYNVSYYTKYDRMPPGVKRNVSRIQNNNLWDVLCDGTFSSFRVNFKEIDSLNYSPVLKTDRNIGRKKFFTSNYEKEKKIVSVYKNTHTIVSLTNVFLFQIIFDFSELATNLINLIPGDNPEILLKIHFIVCENHKYSEDFIMKIKEEFKQYMNAYNILFN